MPAAGGVRPAGGPVVSGRRGAGRGRGAGKPRQAGFYGRPHLGRSLFGALQKRGLVASRPDPEDGRAKMLRISQLGSQQLNRLHAKLAPEREEFFAALSPSEYSTLCSLLERVYRERQAQAPSRR